MISRLFAAVSTLATIGSLERRAPSKASPRPRPAEGDGKAQAVSLEALLAGEDPALGRYELN